KKDQEHLISLNDGHNYVEGSLIMKKSRANNWRSSFFSVHDEVKINALEVVKYYDDFSPKTIDEELDEMFSGLSFKTGFIFMKDVTYVDFLNRVRTEELKLRSEGLWETDHHHPWLNLFVPKSRILDFNQQRQQKLRPFLVYPMNRKRWDYMTSAVISDEGEDIFYTVGLLHSARNVKTNNRHGKLKIHQSHM
ncbi:hypothetical protein M8C21_004061, partial [Ambrosia artemisiifolia]